MNSTKLEGIGNDLRKGFIGLALRNEELLQSNVQLKEQLDEVLKELNAIKKEREEKAARRETIIMDVNKVTHSVSKFLPSKPNITSHSFRIGYISQLWKDTKDIEFVCQTIGHRNLNATSGYVTHMADQECQTRISSIF